MEAAEAADCDGETEEEADAAGGRRRSTGRSEESARSVHFQSSLIKPPAAGTVETTWIELNMRERLTSRRLRMPGFTATRSRRAGTKLAIVTCTE